MFVQGSNHQNLSAHHRREPGPDDVPPEFPGRHQTPGPDDRYDPDQSVRHNDSGSGPWFSESGGDSGGGGFLG